VWVVLWCWVVLQCWVVLLVLVKQMLLWC